MSEAALNAVIAQERDAVAAFIGVLEREQQALVQGNLLLLMELIQEKPRQVEQLSLLASQRSQSLAALGYPPDRSGVESWLDACPAAAGIWSELLKLAETAQQLNRTNGILIDERMRHNQQARAVLLAAAGGPGLYGPDGQPQNPSAGRQLSAG